MNKKLLAVLSAGVICTSLFVGCGGAKEEENKSDFTGVKTLENLYDPTGEKQDMIITEVTFENGTPVDVNIDVRLEDGTIKSEFSKSGQYGMDKVAGEPWYKQIDLLEEAIKENNFDLSKITIIDEAGHTDAVTGVTIKVKSFIDEVQKVMEEV